MQTQSSMHVFNDSSHLLHKKPPYKMLCHSLYNAVLLSHRTNLHQRPLTLWMRNKKGKQQGAARKQDPENKYF